MAWDKYTPLQKATENSVLFGGCHGLQHLRGSNIPVLFGIAVCGTQYYRPDSRNFLHFRTVFVGRLYVGGCGCVHIFEEIQYAYICMSVVFVYLYGFIQKL
jgi:hypothetical protein